MSYIMNKKSITISTYTITCLRHLNIIFSDYKVGQLPKYLGSVLVHFTHILIIEIITHNPLVVWAVLCCLPVV